MFSQCYILDSNIFTAILKKEQNVIIAYKNALSNNAKFVLCPVVFYEVYRGLLYKDAKKQLNYFLRLTDTFIWDEFNYTDWEKAAILWANLRKKGQPTSEKNADLLIGVYAMNRKAVVITDNEKHFIPNGIKIENWRR